jgi:hypothetical protein
MPCGDLSSVTSRPTLRQVVPAEGGEQFTVNMLLIVGISFIKKATKKAKP